MPTNFSAPTSRPTSIGDGYTLFKRSIIPVVPVVDSVVLEEGEVAEPVVDATDTKDGAESEERDGKRKAIREEESSPTSETPDNKKQKQEESDNKSDGEGSRSVKDTETGTGGETPAVPSEGDGDEPKVGDKSVSVPAEPERDHAKQETKEESGSSQL